ncbi:MAG: serine/threonine protein kinase [Deltaproteobacteria bacterium]|nr:serine/threonine protein kinase [Deltaproteobacteria bacterium]
MESPRDSQGQPTGGGAAPRPADEARRAERTPLATALAATVVAGNAAGVADALGATVAPSAAAGPPTATVIRGSGRTPDGSAVAKGPAAKTGAAAAPAAAPAVAPGITAAGTIPARTTVLPRVALVGAKPTLVRNDRLRYEHEERLGQGGVGEVLKTRDNDIGRVVAVKRLRPEVRDTGALIRFVDEIRTVGQLEHPNIVPIHDVGVDEHGEHFFVMKYVGGETVESIIKKLAAGDVEYHRRYPFERRVDIFTQICEAIRYAHARGIIHRDLKPANVMVGPYGEVVVMDWGLAKRVHTADAADALARAPGDGIADGPPEPPADLNLTAAGSLLGTPAYMSPEQARGQPADERSDVYSLCALFYEFLALKYYLGEKKTWTEVLAAVISEEPPTASFGSAHPHQPIVPMDLSWFLKAGLAKDPAHRYQSVPAMLNRLARRREGLVPIQCHVTFVKRVNAELTHLAERHPILFTALLGIAVITAIVLGVRALL